MKRMTMSKKRIDVAAIGLAGTATAKAAQQMAGAAVSWNLQPRAGRSPNV
jgi:hypothetical protein